MFDIDAPAHLPSKVQFCAAKAIVEPMSLETVSVPDDPAFNTFEAWV